MKKDSKRIFLYAGSLILVATVMILLFFVLNSMRGIRRQNYDILDRQRALAASISSINEEIGQLNNKDVIFQNMAKGLIEKEISIVIDKQKNGEQVRLAADILAHLGVPVVENITWKMINGKYIKLLGSDLNMALDVHETLALNPHSPWNGIGRIPVMWPDEYRYIYKQEFNPYTFAQNAAMLRYTAEVSPGVDIRPASEYLLKQLRKYTIDDKVYYDFEYVIEGVKLAPGWTSAFSNSYVAIGLLDLSKALNDKNLIQKAKKYLDQLKWNGHNTDLVMVDESSYLWFEETPPLNGKRSHILNGHMASIFSLYYYMQITHTTEYEDIIKAGLATMARYLWEARRPGKISAYWMLDQEVPDYGPLRAINYAEALFEISGNTIFSKVADAYKTDQPIR